VTGSGQWLPAPNSSTKFGLADASDWVNDRALCETIVDDYVTTVR
jgi:hypothetical protein